MRFKVPDFEKYKGNNCPLSHLFMYVRKMSTQTDNDQLLIHYFQDSLTGAAPRWYMGLDSASVCTFNDLGEAFVKQYKYNVDMAPDRDQLSAPNDFTEMVNMGMRLEEGVHEGRLSKEEVSSSKKYGSSFTRKKEGETNAVSVGRQRRPHVRRRAPGHDIENCYPLKYEVQKLVKSGMDIPEEITRLIEHEEKTIQPYKELVELINLGSKESKREVNIRALLGEDVNKRLVELLKEYVDVFAWSYRYMLGLDTDIIEHRRPLKP
ncbi:hypothetical protein KIW84_044143 [Lathyrus oleraceus]|uniref:Retrotransposon gag domain-containing protein n=1 Tax=Pisum sativum TaxID=3888 RepID=A0A9D4XFN5_PEA|nr:hypothetical protein KIW84_044143 [Pisum sativum]